MVALMRLLIFGLIALTVLYLAISWYSRSVRRQKMERDWEEAGRPGDRNAYIEAGMKQYEHSLRHVCKPSPLPNARRRPMAGFQEH